LNKTENGDYKAKSVYFSSNMSSSSTRVSNYKPKILLLLKYFVVIVNV